MECGYLTCPNKKLMGNALKQFQATNVKVPCNYCSAITYCSEPCRRCDWETGHIRVCKGRSPAKPVRLVAVATPAPKHSQNIDDYEIVPLPSRRALDLGIPMSLEPNNVKLAREKGSGTTFAVKMVPKRKLYEFLTRDALLKDIRAQKRLRYEHLLRLFNFLENPEHIFLIMDYAENGSLADYLSKRRKFSEKEAFMYFLQACLAVDYAHKKGVIVCHLKPETILLDAEGNAKLSAWVWTSKMYGGAPPTLPSGKSKTVTGGAAGLGYLAPELAARRGIDYSADVWSLGVLLHEMVLGYLPSTTEERDRLSKEEPAKPRPPSVSATISIDVQELIGDMVRVNPAERIALSDVFTHTWMKQHERLLSIDIAKLTYQPRAVQNQPSDSNSHRGEGTQNDSLNNSVISLDATDRMITPRGTLAEEASRGSKPSPSTQVLESLRDQPQDPRTSASTRSFVNIDLLPVREETKAEASPQIEVTLKRVVEDVPPSTQPNQLRASLGKRIEAVKSLVAGHGPQAAKPAGKVPAIAIQVQEQSNAMVSTRRSPAVSPRQQMQHRPETAGKPEGLPETQPKVSSGKKSVAMPGKYQELLDSLSISGKKGYQALPKPSVITFPLEPREDPKKVKKVEADTQSAIQSSAGAHIQPLSAAQLTKMEGTSVPSAVKLTKTVEERKEIMRAAGTSDNVELTGKGKSTLGIAQGLEQFHRELLNSAQNQRQVIPGQKAVSRLAVNGAAEINLVGGTAFKNTVKSPEFLKLNLVLQKAMNPRHPNSIVPFLTALPHYMIDGRMHRKIVMSYTPRSSGGSYQSEDYGRVSRLSKRNKAENVMGNRHNSFQEPKEESIIDKLFGSFLCCTRQKDKE